MKEKIIIIWSRIYGEPLKPEEREEWVKYRMKIFMNYTAKSFKRQTNQNFIYYVNYDPESAPYVLEELKKYPELPDNIIFTDKYIEETKKKIVDYKYLYFVRIDSDDMFQRNFIQKLIDHNPEPETQALICQSGYIYNAHDGRIKKWFYQSPPFFTLIYKTEDFLKGFRYLLLEGHKSVITFPHEILEGHNFIVNYHNKNTVTFFESSFCKEEITDPIEKTKIIEDFDLKMLSEIE